MDTLDVRQWFDELSEGDPISADDYQMIWRILERAVAWEQFNAFLGETPADTNVATLRMIQSLREEVRKADGE